jgi:two-component system OmpR family sensor kinase
MLSAQRRFVADPAHQLRAPITGNNTQSEMAPRTLDPAAPPGVLHNIVPGSTRLYSLVTQLLSLARVQSQRRRQPTRQPVDLDRLARTVKAGWIARAPETAIDLGYEALAAPAGDGEEALV